tara:strand:- start:49 stop:222 length:174 start_codon:yes stop_codon:yes gene_type:complete
MFNGYDPERKPPYTHVVRYVSKGVIYETTYYVCNGYAGSISITSETKKVEKENEKQC